MPPLTSAMILAVGILWDAMENLRPFSSPLLVKFDRFNHSIHYYAAHALILLQFVFI